LGDGCCHPEINILGTAFCLHLQGAFTTTLAKIVNGLFIQYFVVLGQLAQFFPIDRDIEDDCFSKCIEKVSGVGDYYLSVVEDVFEAFLAVFWD